MRAVFLILALLGAVAACSDEPGVQQATKPQKVHTTEGTSITFPAPPPTEAPVDPTEPTDPTETTDTTTTPEADPDPDGFPATFPIVHNGVMSLGPGSSYTQSLSVRGETGQAVLDYFLFGLAAEGYTVLGHADISTVPFAAAIDFAGDGIGGRVEIQDLGPEVVGISILLGAPGGG